MNRQKAIEVALAQVGICEPVTVKPCATNDRALEVYADGLFFGMWVKDASAFARKPESAAKDWRRNAANRRRREKQPTNPRRHPATRFG